MPKVGSWDTAPKMQNAMGHDPNDTDWLLFLPRFSRFSSLNVSSFAICSLDNFQTLNDYL